MKDLLKNKKMLLGIVVLAGAVGYYYYEQNKKAKIKAQAQLLANTPATTPVKQNLSSNAGTLQQQIIE